MEDIRKKLLEEGINPKLVACMTEEQLKESQTFENIYDYENYLLALAIIYGI